MDGIENDIGGHDDGEAEESVIESLFAGGDFAWVAGRENIEIATINDIADYEVGGDDGNVDKNIASDGPKARFEAPLIFDVDVAVPRFKAEEVAAIVAFSTCESRIVSFGGGGGKGSSAKIKANEKGREKEQDDFGRFFHDFSNPWIYHNI